MARKITISFKESKRDIKLYDEVMKMDDKSHDVKEILYAALFGTQFETPKKVEKKENNCNLLDF